MDLITRIESLERSRWWYRVVLFSIGILGISFAGKKDPAAPITTRAIHIVNTGGDTVASLQEHMYGGALLLFDTNHVTRVALEADAFGSGLQTRYPDGRPGIGLRHDIMNNAPSIIVYTPDGGGSALYPPEGQSRR